MYTSEQVLTFATKTEDNVALIWLASIMKTCEVFGRALRPAGRLTGTRTFGGELQCHVILLPRVTLEIHQRGSWADLFLLS